MQKYDVVSYVEENIGTFHKKRQQNLESLKLNRILTSKNFYGTVFSKYIADSDIRDFRACVVKN